MISLSCESLCDFLARCTDITLGNKTVYQIRDYKNKIIFQKNDSEYIMMLYKGVDENGNYNDQIKVKQYIYSDLQIDESIGLAFCIDVYPFYVNQPFIETLSIGHPASMTDENEINLWGKERVLAFIDDHKQIKKLNNWSFRAINSLTSLSLPGCTDPNDDGTAYLYNCQYMNLSSAEYMRGQLLDGSPNIQELYIDSEYVKSCPNGNGRDDCVFVQIKNDTSRGIPQGTLLAALDNVDYISCTYATQVRSWGITICQQLTTLILPNVTSFWENALNDIPYLHEIIVDNDVLKSVPAYDGCPYRNIVTTTDGTRFITGLRTVDRIESKTITSFWGQCASPCDNLTSINIDNSVISTYQNTLVVDRNTGTMVYTAARNYNIEKYLNDLQIKQIKAGAFSRNKYILILSSDYITDIETAGCSMMEYLEQIILNNLTSLGDWTFTAAHRLKKCVMPKLEDIPSGTFEEHTSCFYDVDYQIPNAKHIGKQAFYNSVPVTRFEFNKVTSIDQYAFSGCTHLSNIQLNGMTDKTKFDDHVFHNAFIYAEQSPHIYLGGMTVSDVDSIKSRVELTASGLTIHCKDGDITNP